MLNFETTVSGAPGQTACRTDERLRNRLAVRADEKGRIMGRARMGTGDIRIEPFDSMYKSVVQQKPQGTIGYGGLGPQTFTLEALQHIIRANGAMAFQQDTQGTTPHLGEPQLVETAIGIRLPKCASDAPLVIVPGEPDNGLRDILLHA